MSAPERGEPPATAQLLREAGNACVKAEAFERAARRYEAAVQILIPAGLGEDMCGRARRFAGGLVAQTGASQVVAPREVKKT